MEFVHMLSFVERTLGAFADATREELNARAPALLTSAHPRPVSCRLLCANNIFSLHWSRILSLPAFAAAKFNRRHSRRRLRLRRRASSAVASAAIVVTSFLPHSSSPECSHLHLHAAMQAVRFAVARAVSFLAPALDVCTFVVSAVFSSTDTEHSSSKKTKQNKTKQNKK